MNYDNSAKKKKKTILIICLVIISLIVAGGAIFFFSAKKKSQKESPVNEKKFFTEKVKTDLKDYLAKIKNNQTSPQLSYLLLDQNWWKNKSIPPITGFLFPQTNKKNVRLKISPEDLGEDYQPIKELASQIEQAQKDQFEKKEQEIKNKPEEEREKFFVLTEKGALPYVIPSLAFGFLNNDNRVLLAIPKIHPALTNIIDSNNHEDFFLKKGKHYQFDNFERISKMPHQGNNYEFVIPVKLTDKITITPYNS